MGDDGGGVYRVTLVGGRPWGVRLQGGFEYAQNLRIGKVKSGGKAAERGVRVGDVVRSINGTDTERLTLSEALRLFYGDADHLDLELTRCNRKSATIPVQRSFDEEASGAQDVVRIEVQKARSQPPESVMTDLGYQTSTWPLKSAMHHDSLSNHHGADYASISSKTQTGAAALVWSPQGQRRAKPFQPIHFDASKPIADRSAAPPSSSDAAVTTAIAQLKPSTSFWPNPSPQGGGGDDASCAPYQRNASSSSTSSSSSRTRTRSTARRGPGSASPPKHRRRPGLDVDAEYVRTLHPSQLPVDSIRGSSVPVRERSGTPPAADAGLPPPGLPGQVRRFTLEEFTRLFGPRRSFSAPSGPMKTRFASGGGDDDDGGDGGSGKGAAAAPGTSTWCPLAAATVGTWDRKPATTWTSSLPRMGTDYGRPLENVAATLDDYRSRRAAVAASVRGTGSAHSRTPKDQAAPVVLPSNERRPACRVTFDDEPLSRQDAKTSRPEDSAPAAAAAAADEPTAAAAVKSSASIQLASAASVPQTGPQSTQHRILTKKTSQLADGRTSPQSVSVMSDSTTMSWDDFDQPFVLRTADETDTDASQIPEPSTRRLPTFENPLVTLLHRNRESDRPDSQASSILANGPTVPGRKTPVESNNNNIVISTASVATTNNINNNSTDLDDDEIPTIPSVPKKDESAYKDWYRKVFAAIHKTGKDADYTIYDALAHNKPETIPDRPAKTTTQATPTVSKTFIKSVESKKRETPGEQQQGQSREPTAGKKSSFITATSVSRPAHAGDAPGARPGVSPTLLNDDDLQSTFRKIEQDISALTNAAKAMPNHHVASADIRAQQHQQQRPTSSLKKRSLQEPCQLVKPEDSNLYGDDYWLRLAEELEQERILSSQYGAPELRRDNVKPLAALLPASPTNLRRTTTNNAKNGAAVKQPTKIVSKAVRKDANHAKTLPLPSNAKAESLGRARAIFAFKDTTSDKELSFNKGDVITLLSRVDANWYEGRLKDRVGLVPSNYIEVLSQVPDSKPPSSKTQQPTAELRLRTLVLHDFAGGSANELSLKKGAVVTVTRRVDDNWYEGTVGTRRGLFPVSYVRQLPDADTDKVRPTSPSFPELEVMDWLPSPRSTSVEPATTPFDRAEDEDACHPVELVVDCASASTSNDEERTVPSPPPPVASSSTAADHPVGGGGDTFKRVAFGIDTAALVADPSAGVEFTDRLVREQIQAPMDADRSWHRVLYDYVPRHEDELELREGDHVTIFRRYEDGWCVGLLDRTKTIGTFPGNYII